MSVIGFVMRDWWIVAGIATLMVVVSITKRSQKENSNISNCANCATDAKIYGAIIS